LRRERERETEREKKEKRVREKEEERECPITPKCPTACKAGSKVQRRRWHKRIMSPFANSNNKKYTTFYAAIFLGEKFRVLAIINAG
jgi:hypothetical protein